MDFEYFTWMNSVKLLDQFMSFYGNKSLNLTSIKSL